MGFVAAGFVRHVPGAVLVVVAVEAIVTPEDLGYAVACGTLPTARWAHERLCAAVVYTPRKVLQKKAEMTSI